MNGPILVRWQKANRIAESVGWVVAETGQRLVLAGSRDGDNMNGLVQILTANIRERVALEVPVGTFDAARAVMEVRGGE